MKQSVPQDITPSGRKSIRNIPIPDGRRARGRNPVEEDVISAAKPHHDETLTIRRHQEEVVREDVVAEESLRVSMREQHPTRRVVSFEEEEETRLHNARTHRRSSRSLVMVTVLVVFVLAVTLVFFSFGGATVTVYPRQVTTNVNTQLSAANIAFASDDSAAEITFAAQNFTAEATRNVEATGEEEVVEKAAGSIIIYNEYSEEDQRLVKNTRFESPDGLIFRIPESVVVPGLTRDAAGNVVPGKIKTQVTADQPGTEYNIGATRFSVPGFEGLPQYDSFYAQSDTAMSGGFNGVKKIVSDEDRNRAERELRDEIKQQLLEQAEKQTTEELLVLIDDSLTTYETLDETVKGDTVTLGMRGTTKSVTIATADLAKALAAQGLNSFEDGDTVAITNLDELKIRALSVTGDVDFKNARIAIEGDAEFEWQLDENVFTDMLAGISRDSLAEVTRSVNAITRADAKVRPIWKKTFPSDVDDFTIVYVKE